MSLFTYRDNLKSFKTWWLLSFNVNPVQFLWFQCSEKEFQAVFHAVQNEVMLKLKIYGNKSTFWEVSTGFSRFSPNKNWNTRQCSLVLQSFLSLMERDFVLLHMFGSGIWAFVLFSYFWKYMSGFVQVLRNLESPGILYWHWKVVDYRLQALVIPVNLLNSSNKSFKNLCYEEIIVDHKENWFRNLCNERV